IVTMEITDRKVSWNDGSKRSLGRQTNNVSAAPAMMFRELARRQTSGAKIPKLKTNAARITGVWAPTIRETEKRKVTEKANGMTRFREMRRISRKPIRR